MLNPDYKSILNSIDSVILLSNVLFKINVFFFFKKKEKAKNDTIFPPQTWWFLCKLPRDSSYVFQSRKDSMKQGFSLTRLSCFKFHFVIHASPILGRCVGACAWGMQLSSIIPDKQSPSYILSEKLSGKSDTASFGVSLTFAYMQHKRAYREETQSLAHFGQLQIHEYSVFSLCLRLGPYDPKRSVIPFPFHYLALLFSGR